MDNRPIGVFDSGLGGLTFVKELQKALPGESIVYFGDTGRVPYGTRSPEIISKYSEQDARFLLKHGVKAVVAACGTASSIAKEALGRLPVPCITVIEPASAAAVQATKNKKIGVIATPATIKSGSFLRALSALDSTCAVYPQPCPLLVPLVESGFIAPAEPVTRMVLERYLAPLLAEGVDTLILGCTHYPIIERSIAFVMGDNVRLINSGRETALYCAELLKNNGQLAAASPADYRYYVSDSVEGFHDIAGIFLDGNLGGPVERIDIETY